MILAIIFVVLGYQRAKAVGKNGFLWAAIAGAAFIGTQLVVGVGIGAALAIYAEMTGVVLTIWWKPVGSASTWSRSYSALSSRGAS